MMHNGRAAANLDEGNMSTPHRTVDVETALNVQRLEYFSDAVMAIAMTMLMIELRPPEVGARRPRRPNGPDPKDSREGVINFV
ncbi:MAG: hypothetical protein JWP34_53 [Massilia sp.]|nr:hypothetical protein [Massilia sp.]